jgi:hypothetical protein
MNTLYMSIYAKEWEVVISCLYDGEVQCTVYSLIWYTALVTDLLHMLLLVYV